MFTLLPECDFFTGCAALEDFIEGESTIKFASGMARNSHLELNPRRNLRHLSCVAVSAATPINKRSGRIG